MIWKDKGADILYFSPLKYIIEEFPSQDYVNET